MIDVNHNRARQKEPNESCRQRLEEPIPFNPVSAGGLNKLHYGNLPRLLLAWVCSEAVRTQRRELVLGRSLYEFMRKLGMDDRSGVGARLLSRIPIDERGSAGLIDRPRHTIVP